MALELSVRHEDGRKETRAFEQEAVSIGRTEGNDVVLMYPFVSKRHCRIVRQGSRLLLEDLGSANGVLVNGELVAAQTVQSLTPADVVNIGSVEIRVRNSVDDELGRTILEAPGSTLTSETVVPPSGEAPSGATEIPPNPRDGDTNRTAMWEIQTGLYDSAEMQISDYRVGTQQASVAMPPPPAFGGALGSPAPPPVARTTGTLGFQIWALLLQGLGLAAMLVAVALLVAVLLL